VGEVFFGTRVTGVSSHVDRGVPLLTTVLIRTGASSIAHYFLTFYRKKNKVIKIGTNRKLIIMRFSISFPV